MEDSLRRRRRLRGAEFSSLCVATIQLFVRRENFESARTWLAMWKKTSPGESAIEVIEQNIERAEAAHRAQAGRSRNPFRREQRDQNRYAVDK